MSRAIKIIVEKHTDGYVAYPVGLKGVVVAQGDTYTEALADAKSAVQFHIETFGRDVLEEEDPASEVEKACEDAIEKALLAGGPDAEPGPADEVRETPTPYDADAVPGGYPTSVPRAASTRSSSASTAPTSSPSSASCATASTTTTASISPCS
jgi:predicted RNase H-like HicB family nuclease